MTEEKKTYLLEHENGTRRKITVPASWKVTFGPAAKGSNHSTIGDRFKMPMALRFYESDTKQRAIFTDVVSFRDTSIEIVEERLNRTEKEGFVECEGRRKRTMFQATTREWINPDDTVDDKKPLLPNDTEIFSLEGEEEE